MGKKEKDICEHGNCKCHDHQHNHEHEHQHNHEHEHEHQHSHGHSCGCGCDEVEIEPKKLITSVVAFILAFVVFHIPGLLDSYDETVINDVELFVFLVIYLATARDIVTNAVKNLFKGKALDEQFLMTIASLGAFIVGEYAEACAVMLFYLVGESFQDYAVDKSRKSIASLMDIRPDVAYVMDNNGSVIEESPENVNVGQIIVVKPGEKIPLDGIVIDGKGEVDTKALTGESLPREVFINDEVISGSISINGTLYIKTTKKFGESTVSKIMELVENVSERKAKTEKFITKFAKVYTPIVVALAVIIAVAMPLYNSFFGGMNIADFDGVWSEWVYRALTFLVISCPCALVVSVPLAFFAGVGATSAKGVLVKGTNYLEAMADCKTIVLDKTGTLTKGNLYITKIESNIDKLQLVKYGLVAEMMSNHPIALAFKEYVKNEDEKAYKQLEDNFNKIKINEIAGKGIIAEYSGDTIVVGNEKIMEELNISFQIADEIGTVVYVAKNNEYLGYVIIADEIKPDTKHAIDELKKLGIKEIVMLSGDKIEIAKQVAKQVGIDKVCAELLPTGKVDCVEQMLSDRDKLAFVGDGINDAPVLARADIGIAMGALGADAAIEAADVVIMDDSLKGIAKIIKIARKTKKIAGLNIAFALGVKILVLMLAALGLTNMWTAVFADVGVCVLAILNSMRASR